VKHLRAGLTGAVCWLAFAVSANAACSIQGSGEVSTLSNSFPALDVITAAMRECNGPNVKVITKETTANEEETKQALQAGKSPYGLVQLTNSTITPAQAAGQLRPLNDLVAKYKAKYNIEDQMLIKIGSDVMAIAFDVNAQHLFYRKDILEAAGIKPPTSYDEMLADAAKLRGAAGIEYPLGGTYKSGWNLSEEFINNYLGMGGEMFKEGSAQPAFDNATGVKTLEMMKQLISYMSPNALALDTAATTQQLQQGQIAMANMWASRAANMDDPQQSKVVGKIDFAAAPTDMPGGKPATTLWWDGWSIPKNFQGDPDLAFQVMMEGLKDSVVTANNDTTIWLRSVYKPTRFAIGASASAREGAPVYPMTPQQSLAHDAIGAHIGDYFAGKTTPQKALADASDAYVASAKAKGLLN
jgi:multiple sugar transport system substrate-binding protein